MDKVRQKRKKAPPAPLRQRVPPFRPAVPPENPYVRLDSRQVQQQIKRRQRQRKLKQQFHRMSLKTAFAVYVSFFMMLALVLTAMSMSFFEGQKNILIDNYRAQLGSDYRVEYIYPDQAVFYLPADFEGGQLEYVVLDFSDADAAVISILDALRILSIPVLFILCISLAGVLFFRNRLESPIKILDHASRKIQSRDLDFLIRYKKDDEMGRLCESFEAMRTTLLRNNNEMWRQMEERRRLNSAFSHDLRTPLTVLKGNAHMLKEYLEGTDPDEKITGTIQTMENHILRMESYVEAMSRLQKLEDIEPDRRAVDTREFTEMLRNVAVILADGLAVYFYDDIREETLFIDPEMVTQVVENLVSNAARYAKSRISIVCSLVAGRLSVAISDDGAGFSKTDLSMAANPFYKAKKNIYDSHFGLGLNISKILAERHGGRLLISNVEAGGALARAEFLHQPPEPKEKGR